MCSKYVHSDSHDLGVGAGVGVSVVVGVVVIFVHEHSDVVIGEHVDGGEVVVVGFESLVVSFGSY